MATIGLIGSGHIGSQVARTAVAIPLMAPPVRALPPVTAIPVLTVFELHRKRQALG